MENIVVEEIIVISKPGTHLLDCKYDAAVLAFSERRKVTLIHNGRKYTIDPSDVLSVVRES